ESDPPQPDRSADIYGKKVVEKVKEEDKKAAPDRSTCEASKGKASRLRKRKVKKQRAKIEKQKAVPDCDDEAFIFMTRETTRKLIKEIAEKLLRLPIISENDRKFTSHPNAVNLRTSFPPSGINTIPARFHRWYNDVSVVRFPLTSSSTLIIQGGDVSQWFIDGYTDAIVCPENMLGGGGADE
ncbi:O-acetyl-ADP-ribose deacetylase MACROD2, partial [Trifolium medium]|nr:O-acetyl-ADP-ribose deacetylase MACROD2 [Trifolium medium]